MTLQDNWSSDLSPRANEGCLAEGPTVPGADAELPAVLQLPPVDEGRHAARPGDGQADRHLPPPQLQAGQVQAPHEAGISQLLVLQARVAQLLLVAHGQDVHLGICRKC